MLAKDPDQRHRSYDELIAEVTAAHDQLQPPPVSAAAPSRSRKRGYAMAAAVVIAAAAGMLVWSPWKNWLAEPARIGQPFVTSIGMELAYVPPGEFLLGSTPEEQTWAAANDCPPSYSKVEGKQPRKAAIKQGFWLGRTEVTVGHWKQFVGATGYVTDKEKQGASVGTTQSGPDWKDPGFGFKPEENHPVSWISWNDAVAFCEWQNKREHKTGRLPPGYKIRLPTEAEWEYACRAGAETKFWWGDTKEDGEGRLNWHGVADDFEFVSLVDHYGARGRNKFDLADMLGNVFEWCLDEFDPTQAHPECYKASPTGRVFRGGSFSFGSGRNRCAYRYGKTPADSDRDRGLRVACGPTP
jgi:formylglycine-generating enzyme required for sulfatase activity